MRALAAALLVTAIACSSGAGEKVTEEKTTESEPAPLAVEVGKYAKVYSGDEGLTITIVPVKSDGGDTQKALIETSGVQSDIDEMVLLYERGQTGRNSWVFKTIIHGEEYWAVHGDSSAGQTKIQVFLPGASNKKRFASYDKEASEKADPQELARHYTELLNDGTIARLQKFDRAKRRRAQDEALTKELAGAVKACGKDVPGEIDWSSITDDQLKRKSISGYCSNIGDALEKMCGYPEGKQTFQAEVKKIRCRFGDKSKIQLDKDGTLLWQVSLDSYNLEQLAWKLISPVFDRERVVLRSKSGVYLIVNPGDDDEVPIYYSTDGKQFFKHRETAPSSSGTNRYLWAGGKTSQLRFRDGTWTLTCGKRKVELEDLPKKQRHKLLGAAKLKNEEKWKRTPFVLARDDRGRYYYVDHLLREYGGKGFRVFKGLKGRVKLTPLMDIVNDSNGTIFATRDGKLRLLVSRDRKTNKASWIRGKRHIDLTVLPIYQNRDLIFGDLGVYTGESLGSVCEEI